MSQENPKYDGVLCELFGVVDQNIGGKDAMCLGYHEGETMAMNGVQGGYG